MKKRLRHVTIKPIFACTANRKVRTRRRELYRDLSESRQISLETWKKVFCELQELGVISLIISVGEPTLYKNLVTLVSEGHKYGWKR